MHHRCRSSVHLSKAEASIQFHRSLATIMFEDVMSVIPEVNLTTLASFIREES